MSQSDEDGESDSDGRFATPNHQLNNKTSGAEKGESVDGVNNTVKPPLAQYPSQDYYEASEDLPSASHKRTESTSSSSGDGHTDDDFDTEVQPETFLKRKKTENLSKRPRQRQSGSDSSASEDEIHPESVPFSAQQIQIDLDVTRSSDEAGSSRDEAVGHQFHHEETNTSDDESMGDANGPRLQDDNETPNDWIDHTVSSVKPPHKWNSYRITRKREYGLSHKMHNVQFRHSAMGSLHMVERLELMYKLEKHDGCVNCLHFNTSGTRLASGSDDTTVNIWDWASGKSLLQFPTGHRANVFQAKFMPLSGDCHIVTCARDGQVRLAELSARGECKSTRKLCQHRGSAHKLTVENENPHVFLSCGEDAVVFQVDLRDPKPEKILVCKEGDDRVPLYSIHYNPVNGNHFAVSGRDQFCRIYDRRNLASSTNPMKKFCPHHLLNSPVKTNVTCIMYNHNGTELLASYNDDDLYTFDTSHSDGAEFTHRYRGHRNNVTVKGVNYYGPQSEFVVSGSDCGHIFFWEHNSEQIVQFMPGDEGGVVNCLEPHPTCPAFATSGLDHDVKIWIPSCEDPKYDVRELKKLVRKNDRERVRERSMEDPASTIDSNMLWFLISRMRRTARTRRTAQGAATGSHSNSDSDVEGTDSDHDEDGDSAGPMQCRTS